MITRRTAIIGLGGLLAAPAIVRASSLMKLSAPTAKPYPWFTPGGVIPDSIWQEMRRVRPQQIAQEILSVQPISFQPYLDLYNLTRPTPEFPNGRAIQFVGRESLPSIYIPESG